MRSSRALFTIASFNRYRGLNNKQAIARALQVTVVPQTPIPALGSLAGRLSLKSGRRIKEAETEGSIEASKLGPVRFDGNLFGKKAGFMRRANVGLNDQRAVLLDL